MWSWKKMYCNMIIARLDFKKYFVLLDTTGLKVRIITFIA